MIRREGGFYVFSIRLVPVFPFFISNAVLGISKIKVGVFMFASWLGMLPGTIVFVNAGSSMAEIE